VPYKSFVLSFLADFSPRGICFSHFFGSLFSRAAKRFVSSSRGDFCPRGNMLFAPMRISPSFFPALNAFLNGTSAVLIGIGYYFIKSGRRQAHKRIMLAAFVTSTLFLISYLYYHLVLRAGVTHFQGEGMWRPVYFSILISHTFLAVVVVPFILVTLYRALKGKFARHKAIARYTFPIWMYVSVTGVVIFVMLYKIFVR
jgi:putative membrane protein